MNVLFRAQVLQVLRDEIDHATILKLSPYHARSVRVFIRIPDCVDFGKGGTPEWSAPPEVENLRRAHERGETFEFGYRLPAASE